MKIKLHHFGFIVNDLEQWEKNMTFEHKLNEVIDPIQKAKLALYSNYSNSYIELIQPLNKSSYTWNALQKSGNHFNHFCYEVASIKEIQVLQEKFKLIHFMGPVPALLFDNREVFFYYSRNKEVVEFLIK